MTSALLSDPDFPIPIQLIIALRGQSLTVFILFNFEFFIQGKVYSLYKSDLCTALSISKTNNKKLAKKIKIYTYQSKEKHIRNI